MAILSDWQQTHKATISISIQLEASFNCIQPKKMGSVWTACNNNNSCTIHVQPRESGRMGKGWTVEHTFCIILLV